MKGVTMNRTRTFAVAATSLAALAAEFGCSDTSGAIPAAHVADTLQIASSIGDAAVLSSPLHWQATPSGVAASDSVERVEFLIDGAVRWTEHAAPYYYQGDDAGKYIQFLYPTTLARGQHSFAVRVVTKSGQRASSSATVTVSQGAPPVPKALKGTWHRKMTTILKGTWHVRFAPNGIVHVIDPTGSGPAMIYTAAGNGRLTLGRPQNDPRLKEDGGFCPNQTDQSYRWKVTGKRLTITTKRADPGKCRDRRTLFAAVWTRG
jgi:hypothetical protein